MTYGYSNYIYFGADESIFNYFSKQVFEVFGSALQHCIDFKTLNRNLYQYGSRSFMIVFFQKSMDLKEDIRMLRVLENDYKSLNVILVGDNLTEAEKHAYVDVGVAQTISPNASSEVFKGIKQYLNLYFEAASQSVAIAPKERDTKNGLIVPFSKRIFDILVSLTLIICLSPIFLLIYLFIKFESKGDAVYKSKRIGAGYKMFDFYKFRSMYSDADKRLKDYMALNQYAKQNVRKDPIEEVSVDNINFQGLAEEDLRDILIDDDHILKESKFEKESKATFFKLEKDPRVTKVGRIIRKYSLDELPQLFNVLKGDMSIVGNRPLPLYEAEVLTTDEGIERFMAPAGITGLWQVEKRGDNGSMSDAERIKLDVTYAKNYDLKMDIKIMFKTLTAFIQKADV